jgi:oxalate---CoA ligase
LGAPLLVALTSTESSAIAVSPLPPRERRRGSVGLPMVNEVRIRGDDGRFCPSGEIGEIVVQGPLVFDGYLDDPDLNAVSFTDGWLRTGDLGWLDADGYLFLSGRAKDIINRGGEKISPVEIDAAIQSVDGVRAAAAFGIPHPTLGEELVAAVVREPGANITESDVIERVRQQMGIARLPRCIWFVDELPRTDTGKIRRPELARRFAAEAPLTGGERTSAPLARSPTEAALCGLWSSVLDGRIVRSSDDFFLAGGDSLRGARLLTSVKAVFGVELPMARAC